MTINPWDVPKLPQCGDPEKAKTYEAVGLALTNWEIFEGGLRMLFSTLLRADVDIAAKRAFGSLVTFRARADLIEAAAEAYFLIYPARRVRADFDSLMKRAARFGARRNEIAHGRVQQFVKGRKRDGWALYPSSYSTNKNTLVGTRLKSLGVAGMRNRPVLRPRYVYTSAEITALADHFQGLTNETYALILRVGDLWLHPFVRRALKHPEKLSEQDWARLEICPPGPRPRQRARRD